MFLKIRDWLGLFITCHLMYRIFSDHIVVALVLGVVVHTALWIFVHGQIESYKMRKSGNYKAMVDYE